MASLSRQRLGVVLILIAVIGVVGALGVSAATAPSATSSTDNVSGRTLVGMQATGGVTMFNASGVPQWQTSAGNVDYFGTTELENGSVLAAFIADGAQQCGQYQSPCARTGFRVIDPDPQPHITGQWTFPVRDKLNSEVHDVNPLPNGQFLLTDMDHERIMTVAENGSITWQWDASQRYDSPPDPTQTDWLHINDVDPIGPNKYMVSVRNANQVLIIKRGQGVVQVINKDQNDSDDANCQQHGRELADYHNDSGGDIICGDPTVLNHQHNPEYLGPGAVLVADSDNNRVVELHEQNGSWNPVWGVASSNGVRYSWPRDADRLRNGNTLITDSRNNRVVEVAPNGSTVWSVSTGDLGQIWPYEADRLPQGSASDPASLPRYGERINDSSLPRMNTTGGAAVGAAESSIPLLNRAYNGLSYVVALPLWFAPWHIGVIVVGLVLAIVGLGLTWSGRRR